MSNEYILYNQYLQVIICRGCEVGITDDVFLHFQRYHQVIPLESRKAIVVHTNGLIVQPIKDVKIPIQEMNAIEGIKLHPGFKCIAKPGCQEVCGTESSMKTHCRAIHNWNTSKGTLYDLLY